MRRVMIIGQPGSGKSTLARAIGEITHLPVVHIDMIHWQPGWIERSKEEKTRLCREVHARETWIFEGGHSRTWSERLDRADCLIWLDFPLWLRYRRVVWRSFRDWGKTRADLPEGCAEQFDAGFLEFMGYIWRTRNSSKAAMQRLYYACPSDKAKHHLRTVREVSAYLAALKHAAARGNLGISHR